MSAPTARHSAPRDWTPLLIEAGVIVTATPRYVVALLRAEGFELPLSWLAWWVPTSAALSAGMALVEGIAFAYVFAAWRNQKDARSKNLLILALIAALSFITLTMPSIAASVRGVSLNEMLSRGLRWEDALVWAWAFVVGGATISVLAAIGYAQRVVAQPQITTQAQMTDKPVQEKSIAPQKIEVEPVAGTPVEFRCWCGQSYARQVQLAGHMKGHQREATKEPTLLAAYEALKIKYPLGFAEDRDASLPKPPSLAEFSAWRKKLMVNGAGEADLPAETTAQASAEVGAIEVTRN